MGEADELERMRLSGYVELTTHGFALPAYGAGPGANAWYFAIPTIEGDHASTIAGFELLEDEEVVPLPDSTIAVGSGDPWQDVFLWAGRVFIGTPGQIFDAVAVYQEELQALAPLSYLDLAVAAESPNSANLAVGALTFLEGRLGGASGAASFRELVLRPGVLIELRRQFRKVDPNRLPDLFRDFVVREYEPGRFEVEMVPGTAAGVGGEPAAAELRAAIARFGEVIGLPLRATGLDNGEPPAELPEAAVAEPPPSPPRYVAVGRGPVVEPFPNILLIAADRRAVQIARYLEPPLEVAFGPRSIGGGNGYRIERAEEVMDPPRHGHDAFVRIVDRVDRGMKLDTFAIVVWLAGNDALIDEHARTILRAVRSLAPDIPFLIAPAPPADGPSALLSRDVDQKVLLQRCNAIIDTTLARSPFWAGQPRRSVDRRMADIVATVSVVAALDGRLREALKAARGAKQPPMLAFIGVPGKFDVEQATASELNAAGLGGHEGRNHSQTRIAFELRDRSDKRVHNAFLELQPLRENFEEFVEAVIEEALGPGARFQNKYYTSRDIPESVRRALEYPEYAIAVHDSNLRSETLIVTAETPDLTTLREAADIGAAVARYTDVETLRAIIKHDRQPPLPREIRLPGLHRYPRNRGIATRGVDTRDVVRLPEDQWKEMLSNHPASELGGQTRRYLAAIDTRGADPEVALPVPVVWNAINDGDVLAQELLERFPELRNEQVLSGKRTADLITAWSRPSPGSRRWVLEDGRIPVELTQLEPDSIPAQRLFLIDGDCAVPAFLVSRLFAVWARALLPSSTSWASRFQVSKTFDAFPLPWSFAVLPAESGSPPHLRFSREGARGTKLAELVGEQAHHLVEVVSELGHDEQSLRRHPLIWQIDTLLLDDVQLSSDATDLDILEALIERNRQHL